MSSQDHQWGSPGVCPSCGVITEHLWYRKISGLLWHPGTHEHIDTYIESDQGKPLVSVCASGACQALAFWIETTNAESRKEEVRLVYPQSGVRVSPAEGLLEKEIKLYEEAADIERPSPRAARALLRALLERFLKRHLSIAGHSVERKKLVAVIDLAVEHLDLSTTLKTGLTAVREQGNTALHDPYGITDDANPEDLRWLFQAVDELVEELHVRPQKWADLAGIEHDEEPS